MAIYHIKTVKGATEKIHPCDQYTVTNLPEGGYYRDHPEILGLPKGQMTKIVLDPSGEVIFSPRHGKIFIMDSKGQTIDRYPRARRRELRVTEGEGQ